MAYSQFAFVKSPTGTLSGESFVEQTEDAINSLGEQVFEVVTSNENIAAQVQQALATANSAQNTASSALTNSQNALSQLGTLTTTVNTYDQKITQAVSQSTSAVQTATAAQESSQAAQNAAQTAQNAAETASTLSQQAQESAATAQTQAQAAQTAAEAAQDQAADASNSAQQAQQQAQQAQQNAEAAANSAATLVQDVVKVSAQEWETSQQAQARANIGAASANDADLTGSTTAESIVVSGSVSSTGGFVGNLTGTASQATSDGNGNNIVATYATIADTYTKAQVDAKVASVYRFMGSIATYNDLPSSGQTVGDTYNVEDTGANYAWTGTAWDKLSETIDLTPYLTIASAQATYLPLVGGTLTGPLLLSGSPTSGQEAVTKSYVDSAVSSGTSSAVLFTAQSLSTTQQQQACTNISAMPTQDLITVCNEIAGAA